LTGWSRTCSRVCSPEILAKAATHRTLSTSNLGAVWLRDVCVCPCLCAEREPAARLAERLPSGHQAGRRYWRPILSSKAHIRS
jgi:hypothetical protein